MPSEPTEKDADEEALRRQVYEAADRLLSRGIRPSLILIEAEVPGPKRELDHWLRDWAAHLAPDSNYYADPLLLVDRTQDPLIATTDNTLATRLDAAARRERVMQLREIEELTLEVSNARSRLEKLEAGGKSQPATLEKARSRIAALEQRLAVLNRDRG